MPLHLLVRQQQHPLRGPFAFSEAGCSSSVAVRHIFLAVEEHTLAAGTDASSVADTSSAVSVPHYSLTVSVVDDYDHHHCNASVRLRSGSMLHCSAHKSRQRYQFPKQIKEGDSLGKVKPSTRGIVSFSRSGGGTLGIFVKALILPGALVSVLLELGYALGLKVLKGSH